MKGNLSILRKGLRTPIMKEKSLKGNGMGDKDLLKQNCRKGAEGVYVSNVEKNGEGSIFVPRRIFN